MRCDTVVSSGVLRMIFASVLRRGEKARIRLIKKNSAKILVVWSAANGGEFVESKGGTELIPANACEPSSRILLYRFMRSGGENNFVGNRIQVFRVGSKGEYPDVQRLFMRIYGVEFHRPVDIEFVGMQKQLRRIRNDAGATVEDADDFPIDMPFAVEFVRGRKKVIKRPDKAVDFNRDFRF